MARTDAEIEAAYRADREAEAAQEAAERLERTLGTVPAARNEIHFDDLDDETQDCIHVVVKRKLVAQMYRAADGVSYTLHPAYGRLQHEPLSLRGTYMDLTEAIVAYYAALAR